MRLADFRTSISARYLNIVFIIDLLHALFYMGSINFEELLRRGLRDFDPHVVARARQRFSSQVMCRAPFRCIIKLWHFHRLPQRLC